MSLEELINDAAKRGELNHLSIIGSEKGYRACFRVASTCSHASGESRDPVEALTQALKGAKMVRAPRGPSHKPTPEPDPQPATADEMDFG